MKKLNLAVLKQKIEFYPHKAQGEILRNMKRFTVVASAKRLGKSKLAAYLALKELFLPRRTVWIIGPNYELASRPWDYVEEWIDMYFEGEQGPFRINRHDRIIENRTTGSKIWLKTSENPTSLLGKGLDLAIIDEAARIDSGIYDGYIRPNLADRRGKAFMISNPFGYNWFYDEYLRGLPDKREEFPDYISFHYPTAIEDENRHIIGTNNPYAMTVEELKAIQKSTPRDVWTVQYLGEFKEGAGTRFKGIEKCIDESANVENEEEWYELPLPGHLYYVGLDIGKLEDYTVAVVVDRMTHRVVGFYRANGETWDKMRRKALEISRRFDDAEITLDATGHGGDMFVEDLAAIGANIDTEFKYTNRTKNMLIDKLALLMERDCIKFPNITILIDEMRSFTYSFTDSGNVKLGSHRHDDCVNALALACWNLNESPLDESLSHGTYLPMRRRYT